MERIEALDQIAALLEAPDDSTVNTSMRLPRNLRDAAALAVEHLNLAKGTTTLASDALRFALETAVMQAALDASYKADPGSQPSLGDVALALAQQDGREVAEHPDAVHRAAIEVVARHPDATADDVLLWIEAQDAVPA